MSDKKANPLLHEDTVNKVFDVIQTLSNEKLAEYTDECKKVFADDISMLFTISNIVLEMSCYNLYRSLRVIYYPKALLGHIRVMCELDNNCRIMRKIFLPTNTRMPYYM